MYRWEQQRDSALLSAFVVSLGNVLYFQMVGLTPTEIHAHMHPTNYCVYKCIVPAGIISVKSNHKEGKNEKACGIETHHSKNVMVLLFIAYFD